MREKSNKILITLLVFCIIIIIILGGALTYIVLNKSDDSNINSNKEVEDEVLKIKIDDTKDFVYDASYTYDSDYDIEGYTYVITSDYSRMINNMLNVSSNSKLTVPYININSKDAKVVNNKLETIYYDTAKEQEDIFKMGIEEHAGLRLGYKTYYYGDYVSVIVVKIRYGETTPVPRYYGYVFNTKTGELLDSSDIAKIYNKTIEDVKLLFENKIKNFYNDDYLISHSVNKEEIEIYKFNSLSYYNRNYKIQGYNAGYINDLESVIYFITEDGKLNLMTSMNEPVEIGVYTKIFTLDI
ncbi:MAG: hypothetical protein Q4E75_02235 [bacterium]|nr:hypothetical protein [bacterium]